MVNDPLTSALVLFRDLGFQLGEVEDLGSHLSAFWSSLLSMRSSVLPADLVCSSIRAMRSESSNVLGAAASSEATRASRFEPHHAKAMICARSIAMRLIGTRLSRCQPSPIGWLSDNHSTPAISRGNLHTAIAVSLRWWLVPVGSASTG